jgi:hypothetical protein
MDRSGWCLKLPLTEYNQGEHDGCPRHFETRSCACTCGHEGERTLEQRETEFKPYVPPKKPRVDTSVY